MLRQPFAYSTVLLRGRNKKDIYSLFKNNLLFVPVKLSYYYFLIANRSNFI